MRLFFQKGERGSFYLSVFSNPYIAIYYFVRGKIFNIHAGSSNIMSRLLNLPTLIQPASSLTHPNNLASQNR